jgi:outer membrane immunogenic protein
MRPFDRTLRRAAIAFAALAALCGPSMANGLTSINGSDSASGNGWVGGAHGGYNWQNGSAVYGLETDFSFTSLKSHFNAPLSCSSPCSLDNPLPSASASSKLNWFGTVRGRLGWAAGPIMVYGTGGLAYGKVGLNTDFQALGLNQGDQFSLNAQTSPVKAGWVLGAGVDYKMRSNVLVRLGYQYVDLGSVNASSVESASQNAAGHARVQVISLGLTWMFGPGTVASKSWEGGYLGAHAGGSLGANVSGDYDYVRNIGPSDVRLKRDVTLVGRLDDGLGIYSFRYLWSDVVYVGVMAQEVALLHPRSVVHDELNDYLSVDYQSMGIRMITMPEWEATHRIDLL